MKRPWMPLYIGDYLADTGHLTTLQHGAYLLLIMHYWRHHGLPTDERQLMAIARMSQDEWSSNCHVLASFFDGKWHHARIDAELFKSKSISEKRALAGLKGAWTKHGNSLANAKQKPTQSQSHIERPARTPKAAQVEMIRELLAPVPAVSPKAGEKPLVVSSELVNSIKRRGVA